ncbi:hypothetical protein G7Y89_g2025 [Cudoniella acicularis]|uniref:Frequency clock protein n=1 Tax=Cudoniella acicularis TaxID=354080 RepID=A0A8H4RX14_9HELO|nr:hypothetical protein G7Y89_g2025 [Cudoniella acicularis]
MLAPRTSSIRHHSNESNNTEELAGMTAEKWFDRSNSHPGARAHVMLDDDEPPYFLQQNDSSNDASETNVLGSRPGHINLSRQLKVVPSATNGSNADDYRSVIDDLTIENKKLRKRLRKYEASYSSGLNKDRLFEVKIHALPSRKRREFEDTLRAFASTVADSPDESSFKGDSKDSILPYPPLLRSASGGSPPKNTSSSSTSHSRPIDSAYASMSHSGPTSTSTLNYFGLSGKSDSQIKSTKDQKIQSFLQDIPEGLLPKHSIVMTERQKKKLIVRRLEQLFTGKVNGIVGDHGQPLQQQEISNSAAKADQKPKNHSSPTEGVREAHILGEKDMENAPKAFVNESSNENLSISSMVCPTSNNSIPSSPEQRPTRPLDLDPDRAQIPLENVEYIRHLGLSTPQLITEDSGDAESDAQGWIYLNLLINMAQLHIINVTPEFVRSAVADISAKFQLSHDGRKIRWRGGTEGTRLSSDSDASTGRNHSPQDSDSPDESHQKRRKLDNFNNRVLSQGQFASAPKGPVSRTAMSMQVNPFHYKPLFRHWSSQEYSLSLDDESSNVSYSCDGSGSSSLEQGPEWGRRSTSRGSGKKRRDDGPIVFYSGARFCTDLSGDRGNISTPLHVANIGRDGYSNHTQDAIGCSVQNVHQSLERTPSGSLLPFRPFKDYSPVPDFLQTEETRCKTPDLISDDSDEMDLRDEWPSAGSSPAIPLQELAASGLGGTRPADHFAITVETRRTKLDKETKAWLSRLSAPAQAKRFGHSIPKASLKLFQNVEHEELTSRLASLNATASPPPLPPQNTTMLFGDFPVKAKVISTRMRQLEPSTLPAPTAYYADFSSSGSDSDSGSTFSEHYERRDFSFMRQDSPRSILDNAQHNMQMQDSTDEGEAMNEDEDEDNNSMDEADEGEDDIIDMLAPAREIDPKPIAAREEEFEIQVDRHLAKLPAGSSAATADRGSDYSSVED